uniref:Transmembrane protein n=1 Tax=Pediastrum angulosum TaxID=271408 RepID=A0A2U8GIY8_9CHLO|nr:hypothetical protein [Pediastrum angulosum]AWI68242.1 hypothetical protein [Pediastrum angulosum]
MLCNYICCHSARKHVVAPRIEIYNLQYPLQFVLFFLLLFLRFFWNLLRFFAAVALSVLRFSRAFFAPREAEAPSAKEQKAEAPMRRPKLASVANRSERSAHQKKKRKRRSEKEEAKKKKRKRRSRSRFLGRAVGASAFRSFALGASASRGAKNARPKRRTERATEAPKKRKADTHQNKRQ